MQTEQQSLEPGADRGHGLSGASHADSPETAPAGPPPRRSLDRRFIVQRAFELARFVVTGTFSAVLNVLIVMLLTERLGLHYLLSVCVCFLTVTFVSFWINRLWTFRKRQPGAAGDLARYVVTTFVQMGLAVVCLSICVEVFHIPYPIAMLLLSAAFVPVTYLFHRFWSFRLKWLEVSRR